MSNSFSDLATSDQMSGAFKTNGIYYCGSSFLDSNYQLYYDVGWISCKTDLSFETHESCQNIDLGSTNPFLGTQPQCCDYLGLCNNETCYSEVLDSFDCYSQTTGSAVVIVYASVCNDISTSLVNSMNFSIYGFIVVTILYIIARIISRLFKGKEVNLTDIKTTMELSGIERKNNGRFTFENPIRKESAV